MAETRTNFHTRDTRINFEISSETYDLLFVYGFNRNQTFNLTGGVPISSLVELKHRVVFAISKEFFDVTTYSNLHTVRRRILRDVEMIDNTFMRVHQTKSGIGFKLFINQIKEARKLGFTYLEVSAGAGPEYNGYYTWARFGYSMNQHDHQTFCELMDDNNRNERSIIQLMKTEEGRDFWRANGFWWQGIFDLQDESENINALKSYIQSKGYNITF
jgi:hypothetical protein